MHLKSVIHVSTYTRELMMLIHCIADVEKDVSMKRLSPKEAQKLLEDMKVDIPLPKAAVTRNKQNIALDMAIKALNCELFGNSEQLDGEYDPRPDIYYLAEKIGIHRLYALVVQLRGEPESYIDTIGRQAAIDALRVAYWDDNIQSAKDDPCIVDAMTDWAIRQVKALPPAQPELTWETCFDCPLSNGCPKISGCTNDQAEQYASEIPADCPLNKASVQPERKKGKWIDLQCNQCGQVDMSKPNFCPNCGCDMRGEQDD